MIIGIRPATAIIATANVDSGQVVHLQHHRDDGELTAEPDERRADPHAREGRAGRERPQVDEVIATQPRDHETDPAMLGHPSSLAAARTSRRFVGVSAGW